MSNELHRKPEARAETVEDLVNKVRRGFVRIPQFQRGLQWESPEVLALFDSLYRGYPVGSLLFWKRPAEAARVEIGPLSVVAPETSEAWWVVDGQQRLTALTASLVRPMPIPATPDDDFVVYFNPGKREFVAPPRHGDVPSLWVPVTLLLDATQLSEWIYTWHHHGDDQLRRAVFEAGKLIREYSIPLYIIESKDEEPLRQIFDRTNNTGKRLKREDVFNALFGYKEGLSPSTLEELGEDLSALGMGRLSNDRLLTMLVAFRGEDVTKNLREHYDRQPEIFKNVILEALPTLRRVLSFLRTDAEIQHLRLLPKSISLDTLTRFFALHPEPGPRARLLLSRWLWRTFFNASKLNDRTMRRRGVEVIQDDEEASAQALLSLVHAEQPSPFQLPASFDARSDASRLCLLALSHLRPRHLTDGSPIDVAELINGKDVDAFVHIAWKDGGGSRMTRSPSNRLLHSRPDGQPIYRLLRDRALATEGEDPVLASHAVDRDTAARLREDDETGFLEARARRLEIEVRDMGDRLAGWGRNDRPSIDWILEHEGEEA